MSVAPTPAQSDGTLRQLYTDLENSFISFLREDSRSTTTVPATVAAQHFEYRLNALIAAERQRIFDAVEGAIGEDETEKKLIELDNGTYYPKYNEGYEVRNELRAELRAAIKRLREEQT